ncbi:DinB family protein [Streptomyces turgidiscabies]|uniref:Damage-inducible protein DinB n=1 Tax=Streptomyces turgidiscabies TaxID=85558 RepID=A0ABU0RX40_9ACTN|nr:DinB family protein [Streptomyces turgidiscabies]MDQ0936549.1 putative damage-inducible protein DinB [Streptomyces turgidiscabies]
MSTTPDGRLIPPAHADERAMLSAWLDFHRATLALKCQGLDDHQVRLASAAPSTMTLLGLVQHLSEVERNWFQRVFAGLDVPLVHPEDKGGGFSLVPERGLDDALAAWRAEVGRSREIVAAAASLDESGRLSEREAALVGMQRLSLRWIMVHMIEEYARHNGHADLLRELVDGATGM